MALKLSTDTADKPKVSRPRKTPAQRAQVDYDKAVKRQTSAQAALDKLESGIQDARTEVERANAYVEYARKNPDLPAQEAPGADTTNPEVREVTADA